MNQYLIGTGYHAGSDWNREFYQIWEVNTQKYTDNFHVVSTIERAGSENEILLGYNLGHIGTMLENKTPGLSGWSASMVLLAMLAYNKGVDFIYKESDCLWFGDVPGQMYREIGERQVIFGKKMTSPPYMSCAQSTFLVKRAFIPIFVGLFLSLPDDIEMLTENKFTVLMEFNPHLFGEFSFGVDRERPMPFDAPVWYAQQITKDELEEIKSRNLL